MNFEPPLEFSVKSGIPKTNDDVAVIPLPCFVDDRGSLTPIERDAIPFDIARIYFVHGIAGKTVRGNHGHYRTNQVLIAIEGIITIECYDGCTRRTYTLDGSGRGLYVPAGIWTTNHHSSNSVMCVLADRPYNVQDCIEQRSIFKRWKRCQPFSGSFKSFDEMEVDTLENSDWLDYQLEELDNIGKSGCDIDWGLRNVLSNGMVVLDFGGSLGHSYFKNIETACSLTSRYIKYHVVETPMMVDAGNKAHTRPNLTFHKHIPKLPVVDVVYSRTALQYVKDWRGVLGRLANLGAKYMVLSDTQAGKIETFAGVQNWYGHFVRNWFFNIDELIDAIPGYAVQMTSPGMEVNMTNYRKEQRLTHACNLVLRRQGS